MLVGVGRRVGHRQQVHSFTVWSGITGNTGATFTSFTITVKLFVAVNRGLTGQMHHCSSHRRDRVVDGLWFCAGVQVMIPLALIVMARPAD